MRHETIGGYVSVSQMVFETEGEVREEGSVTRDY